LNRSQKSFLIGFILGMGTLCIFFGNATMLKQFNFFGLMLFFGGLVIHYSPLGEGGEAE
jgi:hypothetical protein